MLYAPRRIRIAQFHNAHSCRSESVSAELKKHKVPVAKTLIKHRQSHMQGMTVGKSGAEVNGGKDKNAIAEIDALWEEVESAAKKAHKARAA